MGFAYRCGVTTRRRVLNRQPRDGVLRDIFANVICHIELNKN